MLFKDSIRFKHGTMVRGDKCLWNSQEAEYLGSFKASKSGVWQHLLNVHASWCNEDVVMVEEDLSAIITVNRKAPEVEGQMRLI